MMETKIKSAYQMPIIEIVEITPVNTILEGSNEVIGGKDLTIFDPEMLGLPLDEAFGLPLDEITSL